MNCKSIRLRFKGTMPIHMENTLLRKYGFNFYSRKPGEFVIFEKFLVDERSLIGEVNFHDLPVHITNMLIQRVNKIADCFSEPDKHKDIIATRCRNLAKTLEPKQRAWVLDWVHRNMEDTKPIDDVVASVLDDKLNPTPDENGELL